KANKNLSNERRRAVRISSLISRTIVRRSWHRLNGCRSVTGSVPQLLWMSTEILNCPERLSQGSGHVNLARPLEAAAIRIFRFVRPNRQSYLVQLFLHESADEESPGFVHDDRFHGWQDGEEFPNAC